MIKPINPTPLHTTQKLSFKCEKCLFKGVMHLENEIINTDNDANPLSPLDYDCPQCGKKL